MNHAYFLPIGLAFAAAALGFSNPARSATQVPEATENVAGVRQEAKTTECDNAKDCYVFFNPAPDTPIQIRKVSCNFWLNAGANSTQVVGTELLRYSADKKSKYAEGQQLVVPYANAYGANYSQFQFLADVLWGISASWRPTVHIWFTNAVTTSITCTISGPEAA